MKYVLTMCCAVILTGSVGYANYSSEKLSTSQAVVGNVNFEQKNILSEIERENKTIKKQSNDKTALNRNRRSVTQAPTSQPVQ